MKKRPPEDIRDLIVFVLRQWERGGEFVPDLLKKPGEGRSFSAREWALITASLNGVIRGKGTLDWLIDYFSRRKKPARNSLVRQILRLAIFHLLYLDSIPAYAVLHQAGETGRFRLSPREKAYVNALLREVVSRSDSLPFPPPEDEVGYLSIVHSHPAWLVSRWLERWDFDTVKELCRTDNLPPPIFVRVNRLKCRPEGLKKSLQESGISFQPYAGREDIWEIKPSGPISTLAPFQAGYFQVQDPSTLVAVDLLAPKPGETVADLCAAPGGKASYVAEKMENTGYLLVADVSPKRLEMLEDNFRRLGITNAVVKRINLLKKTGLPDGWAADRILLDVPCSNTGVLRRRVDARWRIGPRDISQLAQQALQFLENAAGRLKPGGRLVYSTCSLEAEENQEVVKQFLNKNQGYVLDGQQQKMPQAGAGDGFYVAVLDRKKT